MKRTLLHIACNRILPLLALMGAGQAAYGQSAPNSKTPPASVRASADQQRIVVGEPIHLLLEAIVPGQAPLTWPAPDTLPHFVFLEKGKIDSVSRPGERYYRQSLTITSFDSGTWAIPRIVFAVGTKKAFTDSVRIEVGFSAFDPNKDYHDIRDIIDVPNPYAKWIGWIVAGISLLSLAIVAWMVGRKKALLASTLPPEAAAPRLPPYEEAIALLEELARQKGWENGPVKVYYTRLNDILRLFVLRRLGIASLAETNEELIGQIRRLPLTAGAFSDLAETLRMCDFVKFAKYQPAINDNEHHFAVIRSSVEGLNQIGQERDAAAQARAIAGGSPEQGNEMPIDKDPGDTADRMNNRINTPQ